MREIRKPNRTGDIFDKKVKVNALGDFKEPLKEKKIPEFDPEFIEAETLEMPLGISEHTRISQKTSEDVRTTQRMPEDTSRTQTISEHIRTPQIISEDVRTSQKTSEDIRRYQKSSHDDSFPLSPDRMDFLLLDGHGKKLLEALIDHGAGEKPMLVKSDELKLKTGQSTNHLSDTIIRLEKKGYIKVKKSYGKGIFEINPSIF